MVALVIASVSVGEPKQGVSTNLLPLFPTTPKEVAAIEQALEAKDIVVPDEIASLVKKLGDDSWKVRETAQQSLKSMGGPVLPALKRLYQEAADYEVRLRIEQIFQSILPPRTLRVAKPPGQLGVRLNMDTEETNGFIIINEVIPGSAAERAGLQAGDILMGLDGWDFPPHSDVNEFRFRIMASGRGSKVKVKFQRAGAVQETMVILDPRDETMVGANDTEQFELWYWQYWFSLHVKSAEQRKLLGR